MPRSLRGRLAIPLVIHADRITAEALNGDRILVDGDQGLAHLRPDDTVASAFRDKIAMQAKAQERYAVLRDCLRNRNAALSPNLHMNAGLMADLPSLEGSGAEGVGLFRTELQFLIRNQMPKRDELARLYARVMDAAKGRRDRLSHAGYRVRQGAALYETAGRTEPRDGLAGDPCGAGQTRRAAHAGAGADPGRGGRPLTIMFPFIAEFSEFITARAHVLREIAARSRPWATPSPPNVEIGAMLETPGLAFAPRRVF